MFASLSHLSQRFMPASGLTRAVMLLAGGSALAQIISTIAAPISTRLYTPQDYGTLAVFNSLLGFVAILATLRYEMAIPLPATDDGALDVFALCAGILTSVTLIVGAAIWLGGDWLTAVTGSGTLRPWVWLFPIGVLGTAIYQSLSYWTLRRRRYKELAQTKFSQSILGTATMLGIGAIHTGPLGLLLSAIVSGGAGIMLLRRDMVVIARNRTTRITPAALWSAAREYRQFPLCASLAALLNSAATSLPPLLLSSLYGQEVTGWFALAYKVMCLPMSLVGLAVGQVFLGEAAKVAREAPERLPTFFAAVSKRLLLPAAIVFVGGAVSPFAFPILFGARWGQAGIYAACLCLFCMAQLVVSPISTVVIIKNRMAIQLTLDAIRAALVVVALWIPSLLGLSGTVAVSLYAFVMTVMYGAYYVAYRRIAADGTVISDGAAQRCCAQETPNDELQST